jgi:Uma2 family endonuclease
MDGSGTELTGVTLANVSWGTYEALVEETDGQPVRLTYDRGSLEIMTLSREHEIYRFLMGLFVVALAEELNLALALGGSMTFRREDLARGLEPDGCFWIANEALVRGKLELDFTRDPPPDLIIEVEISRSALDRIAIYAALRVPEIWRVGRSNVRVGRLQPDGQYLWQEQSPVFANLPVGEMSTFLQQIQSVDHLTIVRNFRAWVRQRMVKES